MGKGDGDLTHSFVPMNAQAHAAAQQIVAGALNAACTRILVGEDAKIIDVLMRISPDVLSSWGPNQKTHLEPSIYRIETTFDL